MTPRIVILALGAVLSGGGAPRVVIVDLDGVRRDTLEAEYIGGRLPNVARLLGEVGNGREFATARWYERTTTVFPTVTMASQASIFTGVPPGRHGIPGNKWFDRETEQVVGYLDSGTVPCVYALDLFGRGGCEGGLGNRHLRTPTLYEAATAAGKTSTVVYSQFFRGATRLVLPSLGSMMNRRKGVVDNYQKFDVSMVDTAIATLRHDGLPDILTVYFSSTDEVGHLLGIAAERICLETSVDPQLGRLLDAIESLDAGWRANTLFVITSDHGRTDAAAAPGDRHRESQVSELLRQAGFDGDHCQVTENGGSLYVYLRSRAAGSRWIDPPRPEDVRAAADALSQDQALGSVTYAIAARSGGPGSGYMAFGNKSLSESTEHLLNAVDSPRSGDLIVLLSPGRYAGENSPAGAQHGSVFENDLAVPIVLALGGVAPGRTAQPIATTDLAGIIEEYLGIRAPAGSRTLLNRNEECLRR